MGETRIAIQENNQLVEVYVEKQDNHRMVGNVYKGKVENVLPGMQAAFVDIGYDLNAFLPFSEIGSDEYIIESAFPLTIPSALGISNKTTSPNSFWAAISARLPPIWPPPILHLILRQE